MNNYETHVNHWYTTGVKTKIKSKSHDKNKNKSHMTLTWRPRRSKKALKIDGNNVFYYVQYRTENLC